VAKNKSPSKNSVDLAVDQAVDQAVVQAFEEAAHQNVGHHAKLGVISFGLALGAACAVFVFFLGIVAAFFEWGIVLAATLSSFLIGFGPSFVGSIAGAVWAFVVGFIFGLLVAWFYNRFQVSRLRLRH